MKLQHLRSLVAVYESGSLQQATKRLHISQSALSRSLQAFEEELGVSLLVRSSHGVTLTPYGLRVIEHAQHILESAGRAYRDIEEMKGTGAQRVSIGLTAVAALSVSLDDAFAQFYAHYPRGRLQVHELSPAAITAMLREGSLDFALSTHPPETASGLDVLTVCHIPLRISARCGHPLQDAGTLRELHDALWLTSAAGSKALFEQFFLKHDMPPPERLIECSSLPMALDLMTGLDALCIGPQMNARMAASLRERIMPLRIESVLPSRPVLLISVNQDLLPPSARRLYQWVQESLQRSHPAML